MSAPQQPPTPYPPPSAVERAGSFVVRLLWTLIPFGTVGLLGWVPAVHVARRRRTKTAWWWLVAHIGATVTECVLVYTVPNNAKDNAGTAAGGFCVAYLIAASVYAWKGCDPEPRQAPQPGIHPGYGTGWPQTLPYAANPAVAGAPATGAAPMYAAAPLTPLTPLTHPVPAPAGPPAPAAAHELAAEVQAELRELRGFLGGEDIR